MKHSGLPKSGNCIVKTVKPGKVSAKYRVNVLTDSHLHVTDIVSISGYLIFCLYRPLILCPKPFTEHFNEAAGYLGA